MRLMKGGGAGRQSFASSRIMVGGGPSAGEGKGREYRFYHYWALGGDGLGYDELTGNRAR